MSNIFHRITVLKCPLLIPNESSFNLKPTKTLFESCIEIIFYHKIIISKSGFTGLKKTYSLQNFQLYKARERYRKSDAEVDLYLLLYTQKKLKISNYDGFQLCTLC